MATYRIYRLKENARQQFRWAPHTAGMTYAKLRDYEPYCEAEGNGPYGVWLSLKDSENALQVGDILESETGELRIYKYVGFEHAQWQLPEMKTGSEPVGAEATAEPPAVR